MAAYNISDVLMNGLRMLWESTNEDLEKFIECFNRTSEDINLNSSFEEIPLQENE